MIYGITFQDKTSAVVYKLGIGNAVSKFCSTRHLSKGDNNFLFPYGCNDNIKGVGNLSSPGCNEINVMSLFNTIPRTKRSHGHKRIQHPNVKKSSKPRTLQDTFNDLLSNIQKPLGIHHIRTILFSLPVNYLKDLRDFGLDKGGVDPFSPKYRLSSIITGTRIPDPLYIHMYI